RDRALRGGERVAQVLAVELLAGLLEGQARVHGPADRRAQLDEAGQVIAGQAGGIGERGGALDHVAQLADVAGPAMVAERAEGELEVGQEPALVAAVLSEGPWGPSRRVAELVAQEV